ncbi:acyltransferase [Nocardioides panacis]|uniref:Acyltransferase n=1 Tax=Nocardioides panacis TaxID=2849501 RepID=A0A975XZF9_9ACTN|nr:acyltransferase [Nocardioides panacis]QWZ07219.1 acyltransferase [Nocardioides panacis]
MPRSNNLDALRLVGAVAVIVGHAYFLLGRPENDPIVLGYPIATLGVVVFFSISGYLITASWNRKRDPVSYLTARVLRIFPGLVVLVLVTVLVLGPLTTTSSVSEYFDLPRTWSYLTNIWLRPQYDLPGVFLDIPYPNAVNGSLWTLPAEFFCYLAVPLLMLWPRRFRPVTVAAFLVVSLWLGSVPPDQSPVVYGSRLSDAAGMWVFFASGCLLRLATERWGVRFFRTDVAVAVVSAYAVFIAVVAGKTPWVSWLALPYAVLAIGLASTPVVRRAARYGDMSYGLYLWAFPVQQVLVGELGVRRMLVDIPLVTAVTLVLAFLSWHAVEHPSLRLKDKITARVAARRGTSTPPTREAVSAEAPETQPVVVEGAGR